MTGFAWEMAGIGAIMLAILIVYSIKKNGSPRLKAHEFIAEDVFVFQRYAKITEGLWDEIEGAISVCPKGVTDELYEDLEQTMHRVAAGVDHVSGLIQNFAKNPRRKWKREEKVLKDAIENFYHNIPKLRSILRKIGLSIEEYKQSEQFKYENGGQDQSGRSGRKFSGFSGNSHMLFFGDCKTKQEAKKMYHMFVKKYHPDNGGDVEKMQAVQNEYDEWLRIHG